MTNFIDLGLIAPIMRVLEAENYVTPTAIQARAIPLLLQGRDLLGIAQTGTGKTAAFGLPLLQKLAGAQDRAQPRTTRALILAPTRELAIQIDAALRSYGRGLKLSHSVIFGGVSQHRQVAEMAKGVDILVATPGRLLDLIAQRHVRLDQVGTFVVDEADRMLDMGFIRDVRRIVASLPKSRQSMLFSATMPDDVVKLVGDMLKQPERVEVAPQSRPAERVEQRVLFAGAKEKRNVLAQLLRDPEFTRVIVFTRTKHGANRVAETLEKTGFSAEAIHGNKSQNARQRALARFRSGEAPILVATDIAARGIDIDEISHVINFELPNEPESYVHRIGRTARAGASGVAISLVDETERGLLRQIERITRQSIQVVPAPAGVTVTASEPQTPSGPHHAKPRAHAPSRPHAAKPHAAKPHAGKGQPSRSQKPSDERRPRPRRKFRSGTERRGVATA